MARRYSGSNRRYRAQKKRRRTNFARTYLVVAAVIALGAYGISLLRNSGPDAPQGSPNEETISAMTLAPTNRSGPNVEVDGDSGQRPGNDPLEAIQAPRKIPDKSNPKVLEAVTDAVHRFKQNAIGLIELRETYNAMLNTMEMSSGDRVGIQDQMEKLSGQWLFSEKVYEGDFLCETYLVESGDTLERIGKRYSVPAEILQTLNDIPRPKDLQAGREIKVVNGPFHVRVRRAAFTMDLYLKNTYVKSYQVGLGMPGHETPTGTWIVGEGGKLIRPEWTDPNGRTFASSDPDYPLGDRWIGLLGIEGDAVGETGFAIHGTAKPREIGKNASRGCIRLHNGNVIEVYNMLLAGLSTVRVFD